MIVVIGVSSVWKPSVANVIKNAEFLRRWCEITHSCHTNAIIYRTATECTNDLVDQVICESTCDATGIVAEIIFLLRPRFFLSPSHDLRLFFFFLRGEAGVHLNPTYLHGLLYLCMYLKFNFLTWVLTYAFNLRINHKFLRTPCTYVPLRYVAQSQVLGLKSMVDKW